MTLLLSLLISGCSTATKTRPIVFPSLPSYSDSNTNGVAVQNSGIISIDSHKLIVTPQVVSHYNSLVSKYGKFWSPPANSNDGVIFLGDYIDKNFLLWTNVYAMSKPAAEKMDWMLAYDRQPRLPP